MKNLLNNNFVSERYAQLLAGGTYLFVANKASTGIESGVMGIGWAEVIISWGTAIIVGYGVLKIAFQILWMLFFGKKFEFKVGILELLARKVKPVKLQEWATMTEEELDKTASLYAEKITQQSRKRKKTHGGALKMGFFKNVWNGVVANKQTILGIAGAGVGAALFVTNPELAAQAQNFIAGDFANLEGGLGLAVAAVAAGLTINAAVKPGIETPTEYQLRVEEKKAIKAQIKEDKTNGTFDLAKTKAKLIKDYGITEAKAQEIIAEVPEAEITKYAIIAEKLAALKAEAEAQKVAEKKEKAEKLAKKLGITVEKAMEIVLEQEAK